MHTIAKKTQVHTFSDQWKIDEEGTAYHSVLMP